MNDATPVRDASGLCGYVRQAGERCAAIQPSGRILGLYGSVAAAMDALRAARTQRTDHTETTDI